MKGELPTLVTDPTVIELSENNAPRSCTVCGDGADYYVFVTDGQVAKRTEDAKAATDSWPINAFLCRPHFAEAPRVASLADHPELA